MELEDWKEAGKYLNIQGRSVFYIDTGGNKSVILLLHGYCFSGFVFHKLIDHLKSDYRVIVPDLMGFGWSDKPNSFHYSIHSWGMMCSRVLEKLEVKEAHLVGASLSVSVLQEMLHAQKQRSLSFNIKSVCFSNGGIIPNVFTPTWGQRVLNSTFGIFASQFFTKRTLILNIYPLFGEFTKPSNRELDQFFQFVIAKGGRRCLSKVTGYLTERKLNHDRWVDVMANPVVPIRLIWGMHENSSTKDYETLSAYRELTPNPDVVELDKIGHFPYFEVPKEFAEHLKSFIKKNLYIKHSDAA